MNKQLLTTVAAAALLVGAGPLAAETVTIATVNNGDMIVMQKLSSQFEEENPDIDLEWVVLEENVLRQRATTDIATGGGQFDVMTIGTYEVPIWAAQGWLEPMDGLPPTTTTSTTSWRRSATGSPTRGRSTRCPSTARAR